MNLLRSEVYRSKQPKKLYKYADVCFKQKIPKREPLWETFQELQ